MHERTEVQWAKELVLGYLEEGWRIEGIECPVDIFDEFGSKITAGAIDLVLERNREFLIIDWKTGDRGDYDAQVCGYVNAWWDLYPESKDVRAIIAYVDLGEKDEYYVPPLDSAVIVLALYDRWKNKEREPYVISSYCDWCGFRGECPAWRKEADATLSQVALFDLEKAKIDELKNDPKRLDKFLIAWNRAKTLVEEDWNLKEALRTHMQTGFKAENHVLVTRKIGGVKSIDPEQFLERIARKMGFMKAAQLIKVDAEKAIEAWTDFTSDPFPIAITETDRSETQYIRVKGKPGAGEARKKRKEME